MTNYAQSAYDYAKANSLTSAQMDSSTKAQLAIACDVQAGEEDDFRPRLAIIRRRVVQRLRREERVAVGQTQKEQVRIAVQSVLPNATGQFISAEDHVTIDGPAFVIRRAE